MCITTDATIQDGTQNRRAAPARCIVSLKSVTLILGSLRFRGFERVWVRGTSSGAAPARMHAATRSGHPVHACTRVRKENAFSLEGSP